MNRSDLRFWGGVFMGIGIGCPYLPLRVAAFAVAAVFAVALTRGAR